MMPSDATMEPGSVILGRYELLDRVGRGGFGEVFKARQQSTGQTVAVKALHNQALQHREHHDELAQRFWREMTLIGKLHSPHVVGLIDSGLVGERPVMVLEYVRGQSLSQLLKGGPLSPRLTKQLMGQLLEALIEAHQQGVVHRDLKPDNLMVIGEGRAASLKVLDFGIAGVLRGGSFELQDLATITTSHDMRGTPEYMAPEQLRRFSEPHVESDLYAVGLMLYECLTGERAVVAPSMIEVCERQLNADLSLPPTLRGTGFGDLILKAVNKAIEDRYRSAEAMLTALDCVDVGDLQSRMYKQALDDPSPVMTSTDEHTLIDSLLEAPRDTSMGGTSSDPWAAVLGRDPTSTNAPSGPDLHRESPQQEDEGSDVLAWFSEPGAATEAPTTDIAVPDPDHAIEPRAIDIAMDQMVSAVAPDDRPASPVPTGVRRSLVHQAPSRASVLSSSTGSVRTRLVALGSMCLFFVCCAGLYVVFVDPDMHTFAGQPVIQHVPREVRVEPRADTVVKKTLRNEPSIEEFNRRERTKAERLTTRLKTRLDQVLAIEREGERSAKLIDVELDVDSALEWAPYHLELLELKRTILLNHRPLRHLELHRIERRMDKVRRQRR